jgi:hypothetical protein
MTRAEATHVADIAFGAFDRQVQPATSEAAYMLLQFYDHQLALSALRELLIEAEQLPTFGQIASRCEKIQAERNRPQVATAPDGGGEYYQLTRNVAGRDVEQTYYRANTQSRHAWRCAQRKAGRVVLQQGRSVFVTSREMAHHFLSDPTIREVKD